MRLSLTACVVFFLLTDLALCLSVASAKKPRKPNIVLVVADDLGFADVGFHGSDIRTPTLDRLATEGVRLEQFYVAPMCSPTRAGLMTGRYPLRYGLMRAVIPPHRDFGLSPAETTLAEALAAAGYKHRAMIGKWHLGHRRHEWLPTQQGFTHFVGCYGGAIDYFTQTRGPERDWHRDNQPLESKGYATDLIGDAAVAFTEGVPRGEPFFLYVAFTAPHQPLQALPQEMAKYPRRQGNHKAYAAMVDRMDQNLARIVQQIEQRGELDQTFILFLSDNGGIRGIAENGAQRGGKLTPYQGGIRVPAVAHWPTGGVTGGAAIDEPISYIDVLPTLIDSAGWRGTLPQPLDGVSVLAAMQGGRLKRRCLFTYQDHNRKMVEELAANCGQWKLVLRRGAPDAPNRRTSVELYDLKSDPSEFVNLATRQPRITKQLLGRLETFYRLKADIQIPRYDDKSRMSGPPLPSWQPKN